MARIGSFRGSCLISGWFMGKNSMPTAPNNHLPDWAGPSKNARGQKWADSLDELRFVQYFLRRASDNRIKETPCDEQAEDLLPGAKKPGLFLPIHAVLVDPMKTNA